MIAKNYIISENTVSSNLCGKQNGFNDLWKIDSKYIICNKLFH